MVAHIYTVAFQGIEAREVDVQVHVANQTSINNPFSIVGLADKAVAESRERGGGRGRGGGGAPPSPPLVSRCPTRKPPSPSPLPICRRKAATTTCQLHL